eukprot:5503675-Pyramimonas_sp.AAC.1
MTKDCHTSRVGRAGMITHTGARGAQRGRGGVVQATSSVREENTAGRSLVPRRVEKVEKFTRLPVSHAIGVVHRSCRQRACRESTT